MFFSHILNDYVKSDFLSYLRTKSDLACGYGFEKVDIGILS